MKKLNWLLSAFALLAFAACEPTPEPEPTPEVPTDVSFTIELNEVGATSVNFDITPSSEDVEYYVDIYDKRFADAFSKDEHIVGTLYDEIAAYAGTKGMTLSEYLAQNTFTGTMTDVEFTGLAPESEYYLLAFAVDASNDYALVGAVAKQAITTTAMPTLEVEFDVTTEVYYNTVTFDVKPSDKSAYWHLITVPEAMLTQYMEGNGWTESQFYFEYMKNELSQYQGAGYSVAQIMAAMFPTGDKEVTGRGLNENAEYVYLIAAVIISDAGEIVVGMDPVKGYFTTEDALPSEMVFNIEVTNVEATRASILVKPSVNNETFVWRVGEWDGESDAQAVMQQVLDAEMNYLLAGYGVSQGTQDFTGGPGSSYKYRVDSPDTDYYVLAFGFAGGVTTAPQMVTFRTLDAGNPAEATFTMKASGEHTYGFKLSVTCDNPNVYYFMDVLDPAEFDEEEAIAFWNENIVKDYEFYCGINPTPVSMASYLRTIAFTGNATVDANVVPDADVMGYVLALNPKTGQVAKCHVFPELAHSKPQSSYEPTIELVGYFSGDEEAGQLFGEPEVSAGMAILVYKFNDFDDAKALYAYYDLGNSMSDVEYPDYILANKGSWRAFTALNKPYDFAVGMWNTEYTAAVYALDAEGYKSRLGRLLMYPTAEEKQPIENLFKLYDELYGAAATAAPASLVIKAEEEVAPVATGIVPVKVEEPKAVAKKSVELNAVMILNDIVRIPCGR